MSEKWTADRAKLELAELDLSSLDSVREFAATSAISPSPAS